MTSMLRRARASALLIALVLGCAHPQEQGAYAITAEEIVRDDCGLLASPEDLWDGELIIDGEVVRMRYDLYGTELRGRYQQVSESFYLDGTASMVSAQVAGAECLFDVVNIHLEGTVVNGDPGAFTGLIRVDHDSRQRDACRCQVNATLRAERK